MTDDYGNGMKVSTVVRMYCNGPSHNHEVFSGEGEWGAPAIEYTVMKAGWRQSPGGLWFCALHAHLARDGE